MARHCLLYCALLFTGGFVIAGEPVRVMSFNLRYGLANDGANRWEKRRELVAETVRAFDPDLLGTQETLAFQAEFLSESLPGYDYFGRSRTATPNEHCGIFYRRDRFTWLAGGHFWLSEHPDRVGSKSWDAALPRMATWVLLEDRTDPAQPVLMLNTHFDHRGEQSRTEAARVVAARLTALRAIAEQPRVIVTGDFNTPARSRPHRTLLEQSELQDTFAAVHPRTTKNVGTFHGFAGRTDGARIDWVLAGVSWKVDAATIDQTAQSGRYPSDHCPVTATLSAGEK